MWKNMMLVRTVNALIDPGHKWKIDATNNTNQKLNVRKHLHFLIKYYSSINMIYHIQYLRFSLLQLILK